MVKLTTDDFLNIINNYASRHSIPIDKIGTEVEFCKYYTDGLAILVHHNNDTDYISSRGNRLYSIAKGSIAKYLGNDIQAHYISSGYLKYKGGYYEFLQDTEPLTIGKVMRLLTVSGSPSVNKNRSFANCIELTDLITGKHNNKVKEAEHSLTSDEASSLSEEAKQQSEEIAQRIYDKNKAKEEEEIRKKLKSFVYKFNPSEPYIDKILEYNNSKLEIAIFNLDVYHTLYVTGLSRSGKTYLCKEISGKYCNIDTSKLGNDEYYFSNLMWVPCHINRRYFIRKFAEFCVHNLNSEKCLLVLNEATKEYLYKLLPIWEDMDRDGKKFKEIIEEGLTFECDGVTIEVPKGLRILANVADGQNKDDIEQVVNRFVAHIDMNQLTDDISAISQYTGIDEKILKLLYSIQDEMIKQYGMHRTFLVIYRLKYDKRKHLEEIYNNQCSKLFGPKWKEAKALLREYIDNEI